MRGFLKFLLVLIGAAVFGMLVLFFMIGGSVKDIDVEWTPDDYNSYNEKIGNGFIGGYASMEDVLTSNVIAYGEIAVNEIFTDSELTAIANISINENSVVRNVKINCLENDQFEMSAVIVDLSPLMNELTSLKKYEIVLRLLENKEIYICSSLQYDHENELFVGTVTEMSLGKASIPISQANKIFNRAGLLTNNALSNLQGFSVNSFELTDDGCRFSGTIPEFIESDRRFMELPEQADE